MERLDLERTRITDKGLVDFPEYPKLAVLALDYNAIQGEGLRHLNKLPSLDNLGLRATKLTSAGLECLSARQLSSLDISHTEVNEHALEFLKSLRRLKHLDNDGCGFYTKNAIPGIETGYVIRLQNLPANIAAAELESTRKSNKQLESDLRSLDEQLKKQPSIFLDGERSKVLVQLGRYAEALPGIDKQIDYLTHPQSYVCSNMARGWTLSLFKMYLLRAQAYNSLNDFKKSIADSTAAVNLNRLSVAARKERGFANLRIGNLKESLADFERAIELSPSTAELYQLRAEVSGRLGRAAEAKADAEEYERLASPKLRLQQNVGPMF